MTRFSFVRIKPCKLDVFSHLYTNGVNCKKKTQKDNLPSTAYCHSKFSICILPSMFPSALRQPPFALRPPPIQRLRKVNKNDDFFLLLDRLSSFKITTSATAMGSQGLSFATRSLKDKSMSH